MSDTDEDSVSASSSITHSAVLAVSQKCGTDDELSEYAPNGSTSESEGCPSTSHAMAKDSKLMLFSLKNRSEEKKYTLSEDSDIPNGNVNEPVCDTAVPSIFIDEDILSSTLKLGMKETEYSIFKEFDVPKDYVPFKLLAERRSNIKPNFFVGNLSDEEQYCWTPGGSSDEEPSLDENIPLSITIQKLPTGVIINSNVFLTTHQWHTIDMNDVIVSCLICSLYMSKNDIHNHVQSSGHTKMVDSVKPLAKYDLSIVRKIREHYHCGVCNITFDLNDETEHMDSKSHENNLLFAINKVCDVLDYCEPQNNDSASTYESCDDDNDDENNDDEINDDENYDSEWVIATNQNPALSYANKLKTVSNAPKHYDIDLKNKKLKVTYNCWHMIGITKNNSFYCMACKLFDRLTMKIQHCESVEHLENLNKCKIDHTFEEHFIRKVEHLYHCGHCNSLQSDIEAHLELKHNRKPRKISENATTPAQNNDLIVTKLNDTPKNNDKVNNNYIKVNDNAIPSTSKNCIEQLQNVIMDYFMYKITLPALNYNAVIKQYNNFNVTYYCTLCNINVPDVAIMLHINTLFHIQLLQYAKFIIEFGYHMIRNVHGMYHCAICNVIMSPTLIHHHIQDKIHDQRLRASVFFKQTPLANINNDNNPKINENNDKRNNKINENNDKINDKKEVLLEKSLSDEDNDNESLMSDTLNDTVESFIDLSAYVFIKFNDSHMRVTITSYNTLVPIGDGNIYCFVCSSKVNFDDLKIHVESRSHVKNVDDCNFIDLFEGIPIRQMYRIYHCCICNVLMNRSHIKDHLEWPQHAIEMDMATKVSKKQRRNEIKSGTTLIIAKIVKEQIYDSKEEIESKILYAVDIVSKTNEKNYKMIIVGDNVLKVGLDNWNGIANIKDGIRCIICQKEIDDAVTHVKSQEHELRVKFPLIEECLGDLLREINKNTYHCIICNAEVSNLDDIVSKHIGGKKHKKKYAAIKEFSAKCNGYDDCIDDILQL